MNEQEVEDQAEDTRSKLSFEHKLALIDGVLNKTIDDKSSYINFNFLLKSVASVKNTHLSQDGQTYNCCEQWRFIVDQISL